jgi:NAD(P)-dependent dehydrogenase (short-subunit alcohol dehydrogenase family)
MKELSGRTAFVTGGNRGIGRSICIALAEAGADIALNYSAADDRARDVVKHLKEKLKVKAEAYKADISDEANVRTMVEKIEKTFGRVTILVNNAGINRDKSFVRMTRAMWDEVLGVNLNGPFNVTNALLPGMIEEGWGRVINISSMGGQTGNFGQANYTVTKGGLIAFTMTLAREVARKGVTVNAVSPGYTLTDMTAGMPDAVKDQVQQLIPMGRMGEPEEIASTVAFLAGTKSSYITGQVLSVNGGMYM